MQTQLTHLSTLSQQRFSSNERDIPLFEEAFDTVSLRKFFQKQDSTSNTPLTFYSESPVVDDFQLFDQESRSIFSSPMKPCAEDCPIVYSLPTFTLQSELDEGLCTTISGFMEKKFDGLESHDAELDLEDQFGEEDTETGQLSIDGERKAGCLDNGNEFSVNIDGAFFAQRAALDDEPMIQDTQEMLLEDECLEESNKIDNWNFESKLKSKTLFIIERNVARKVIEKKPKEKKKSATLEKKKKLKKAESEKEQNKENEEPVVTEGLKKKYKKKILTATESEAKKKDKEAKVKAKKVKEDGDKKVSKKKEKVKTDKSAAKKH